MASNTYVVGLMVAATFNHPLWMNSSGTKVADRKISGKKAKVAACAAAEFLVRRAVKTA